MPRWGGGVDRVAALVGLCETCLPWCSSASSDPGGWEHECCSADGHTHHASRWCGRSSWKACPWAGCTWRMTCRQRSACRRCCCRPGCLSPCRLQSNNPTRLRGDRCGVWASTRFERCFVGINSPAQSWIFLFLIAYMIRMRPSTYW